jgi:hypothetical protein
MHISRFIDYVLCYPQRKHIDWTLKKGDRVVTDSWPEPIVIVDINWSLWAAAVRLGPAPEAIVVWPLWRLRRYAG